MRGARVQIVISDGLNANALNENLRAVLPPLRHELGAAGLHTGDVDIVIQKGACVPAITWAGVVNQPSGTLFRCSAHFARA
jgi:ethanolamine ammonia-lyase small subunit